VRFTKVVGPPGSRPRFVGIRRLPERYADRQNIRFDDEPPEEPERAPAARPEPAAVKPASYFLLSLVFSALLFAIFFVGDRGFLEVRRQRAQLRAAQDEVAKLDAENRALEAEVSALKNDPRSLEKIAREKLGLAKPGEVVVVLPEGWEKRVKPGAAQPPGAQGSSKR
jgi:cell division protein FtsL